MNVPDILNSKSYMAAKETLSRSLYALEKLCFSEPYRINSMFPQSFEDLPPSRKKDLQRTADDFLYRHIAFLLFSRSANEKENTENEDC